MLRRDACAPICSSQWNFGFLSGAFRNFCVTIAWKRFVPNGPPIERERSMANLLEAEIRRRWEIALASQESARRHVSVAVVKIA